jgi:hypothetical protein
MSSSGLLLCNLIPEPHFAGRKSPLPYDADRPFCLSERCSNGNVPKFSFGSTGSLVPSAGSKNFIESQWCPRSPSGDSAMAHLAELGSEPMPLSAPEFSAFIAAETAKWAKVVKFANIKPE